MCVMLLDRSSVLYDRATPPAPGSLVTFHQKMATHRSFVMDATLVHANAVVLFGGKLAVDHVSSAVTLDGWLSLSVPARTAVMIKELRKQLEALLRSKVQHPRLDLSAEAGPLVSAVVMLLNEDKTA